MTDAITVYPALLQLLTTGEVRPLSPSTIRRMEREHSWLKRYPEFWNAVKAGRNRHGLGELMTPNQIFRSTQLRALFPTARHPALTWPEHATGARGAKLTQFVRDLLEAYAKSASLILAFEVQTKSGWRQALQWKLWIGERGRLASSANSSLIFGTDQAWSANVPVPKLPPASRAGKKSRHRDGVKQVWSLPAQRVFSLGMRGDLLHWDARSGTLIGKIETPGYVLHGSLIGDTFCYVTDTDQLATYDVRRRKPLWVMDLPAIVAANPVLRIERLDTSYLAVITQDDPKAEQAHVLGPFPDLPLSDRRSRVEYGCPEAQHLFAGAGILKVKQVPQLIEPLRRGRTSKFIADPELARQMRQVNQSACLAGNCIITRSDHSLYAWDIGTRHLVAEDFEPPPISLVFGFASGLILSYGQQRLHLRTARNLQFRSSMLGYRPNGAFIAGGRRLVAWNKEQSLISSWKIRTEAEDPWLERVFPLLIRPSPAGLDGICHLTGNQLVSWSKREPTLRVWDFASGSYIRGFGA